MVANIGYNRKANMYHKHIGKRNINDNELNYKYIMDLEWSQTIETLCSTEMHSTSSLIKKRTDLDAKKVEWMHPLEFSAKSNSYDNQTWNETMYGTHKEGYWSEW